MRTSDACRLRVAVLMGGQSPEHEVSCSSGEEVLRHLDRRRYDPLPIEISRDGAWRVLADPEVPDGRWDATDAVAEPGFERLLNTHGPVDLVFIALHGAHGEDGRIQGLLESHHIPYTGSGVTASAVCMDKILTRRLLRSYGIDVPRAIESERGEWEVDRRQVLGRMGLEVGFPCFVKAARGGSSVGVHYVHGPHELDDAVEQVLRLGPRFLVEEAVPGVELTCGVLGNTGDALEPLPVVEIHPRAGEYFTYDSKYRPGGAEEICPARLPGEAVRMAQEIAMAAHWALGCDGMSRADMIWNGRRPRVLEVNTIPGLTAVSLLPKAASAGRMSFARLLDRIIELAIERFAKRGAGARIERQVAEG